MPPTFRTAGQLSTGASTATSFSPTMPVGFVAGDLLIGIANGGLGTVPATRPTGSTALLNVDDGTTFNMDVVWKIAAGGDVFTWTVGVTQKWAGTVCAITVGTFDTTTPITGALGVAQGTTAQLTFVTPSSTPGNADSLVIAAFGQQGAATWTCNQTAPTMAEFADSSSSGTSPVSIGAYRGTTAPAQTAMTRTGSASLSSANGGAMILFVNPAAGAAAAVRQPRRQRPQMRR